MAASEAPAAPAKAEPNHGLRIFLIWIVLALVADLLIWFVWYPHLPPGDQTSSAQHQQFDSQFAEARLLDAVLQFLQGEPAIIG